MTAFNTYIHTHTEIHTCGTYVCNTQRCRHRPEYAPDSTPPPPPCCCSAVIGDSATLWRSLHPHLVWSSPLRQSNTSRTHRHKNMGLCIVLETGLAAMLDFIFHPIPVLLQASPERTSFIKSEKHRSIALPKPACLRNKMSSLHLRKEKAVLAWAQIAMPP